MGFWGIEVKPGTPHRHLLGDVPGKLHVTQATLGSGSGKEKSVLQCSIGDGSPIYLCSLLPNKSECCPLNLEFDDDNNAVSFSVVGPQSIHLSGYIKRDEDDSYGIDIAETESDESSDYDSEEDYEDDFIDDDYDDHLMYPPSSAPNSGVVIEEIVDEEEPSKESQPKRSKKKNQSSEDKNTNKQIAAKGSAQAPDLESEDEDGFPISKSEAGEPADKMDEMMKGIDSTNQVNDKKRKAKTTEQDGVLESENKKKKKKKQKEKQRGENANGSNKEADEQPQKENMPKKEEPPEIDQVSSDQNENGAVNNVIYMDKNGNSETADNSAEKKKKNKKKKKNQEAEEAKDKTASSNGDKETSDSASEGKQANLKSSHVRTYPNGLVVEELAMGKPDGKRASPGKQVSMRYIGKLQKNGKIFDSNIGKAPLKFRLGLGQVIKGWDIGVNGMRIGDKRKLTIPPSMGYGQRGAGGKIPPNAWLVFDVELIDVR